MARSILEWASLIVKLGKEFDLILKSPVNIVIVDSRIRVNFGIKASPRIENFEMALEELYELRCFSYDKNGCRVMLVVAPKDSKKDE